MERDPDSAFFLQIYGDEIEFAEDFLSDGSLHYTRRPSKRGRYGGGDRGGKLSGDSNSTSPDHKRECNVRDKSRQASDHDVERGGAGSGMGNRRGNNGGYVDPPTYCEAVATAEMVADKTKKKEKEPKKGVKPPGKNPATTMLLKYMKVRVSRLDKTFSLLREQRHNPSQPHSKGTFQER